jgi:hypothetical protein
MSWGRLLLLKGVRELENKNWYDEKWFEMVSIKNEIGCVGFS